MRFLLTAILLAVAVGGIISITMQEERPKCILRDHIETCPWCSRASFPSMNCPQAPFYKSNGYVTR